MQAVSSGELGVGMSRRVPCPFAKVFKGLCGGEGRESKLSRHLLLQLQLSLVLLKVFSGRAKFRQVSWP